VPSVIDSHVHLYPDAINRDPRGWATAHGEPQWEILCTRRRKNGRAVQGFPGVDELLREMDVAGVARAVLLGWYWERAETCAMQNRFYADCVRAHPDRLSGFATVQPRAGGEAALGELARARDEGLIGVGELSPHAQGYDGADEAFRAVLARAGEWGMAVNLHVTDPESGAYPGRVATPLADFAALARAFPTVNFILAHWGGLLPLRAVGALMLPNIFYDTAASPLLYDAGIWARFISAVGAERVLFGSDFPLNVYPKLDAAPVMTRLLEEARAGGAGAAVLAENAARVLGVRLAV